MSPIVGTVGRDSVNVYDLARRSNSTAMNTTSAVNKSQIPATIKQPRQNRIRPAGNRRKAIVRCSAMISRGMRRIANPTPSGIMIASSIKPITGRDSGTRSIGLKT